MLMLMVLDDLRRSVLGVLCHRDGQFHFERYVTGPMPRQASSGFSICLKVSAWDFQETPST
jgi:hypothetical protein